MLNLRLIIVDLGLNKCTFYRFLSLSAVVYTTVNKSGIVLTDKYVKCLSKSESRNAKKKKKNNQQITFMVDLRRVFFIVHVWP